MGKSKTKKAPAGLVIKNASGRDPRYYAKKQGAEAGLGRTLTTAEFERDHYQADAAPAAENLTSGGTSIFDPVLCELVYRWFCPPGGLILDPFAGGSVRGVVAGMLGRCYNGIDLRPEQAAANRAQWAEISAGNPDAVPPSWIDGDARDAARIAPGEYDLVFSCPPYFDLERYSDDPADLSAMTWEDFCTAHAAAIAAACGMLRPDRFAVWVIGDVRDEDGCYRDLPGQTIASFLAAGLRLYNDAILVTPAGSLPVRAGRQFASGRKLGTTHQRVLVFVKGSPEAATAAIGDVQAGDMTDPGSSPEIPPNPA